MVLFFFFHHNATTEIYTLSLHDALPIWPVPSRHDCREIRQHLDDRGAGDVLRQIAPVRADIGEGRTDRKSTRLNSSHPSISYAVFCLKKKKKKNQQSQTDLS